MGFGRLLFGFFAQVQITARFSLNPPAEQPDHSELTRPQGWGKRCRGFIYCPLERHGTERPLLKKAQRVFLRLRFESLFLRSRKLNMTAGWAGTWTGMITLLLRVPPRWVSDHPVQAGSWTPQSVTVGVFSRTSLVDLRMWRTAAVLVWAHSSLSCDQ